MFTQIIYHSTEDKDFKKEFAKITKSKPLVKSSSFYIENNLFSQKIFLKNEMIGKGGFGEAFKFSEIKANENYVVKVIRFDNESELRSIQNEAKLFEKVNGYCVLLIAGQIARLVMKNLPGHTLEKILMNKILNHQNFSNPKSCLQICISILKGVHALHQMKIVHGDLSERNILLDKNNVYFCDFGHARTIGDLTSDNWGSGYIFAPELRKPIPADPIQDVFSLGELLSTLMDNIDFGKFLKTIETLISKMLEKDPALRISLIKVIRELESLSLKFTNDKKITR